MNMETTKKLNKHLFKFAQEEADNIAYEAALDADNINDWSPAELILYMLIHGYLDGYYGLEETDERVHD